MLTTIKHHNFILDNFPSDYQSMTYVELWFGNGSLILSKESSKEEVINDDENGWAQHVRTLRDQSGYCLRSLKKANGDIKDNPKTDVEALVNVLRPKIEKKSDFDKVSDQIKDQSKRLEEVYVLSKPPISVIKTFNRDDTLLFINSLKKDSPILTQANLANSLLNFKGKTVLIAPIGNLYGKFLKGWKSIKKPDFCLWLNWKNS